MSGRDVPFAAGLNASTDYVGDVSARRAIEAPADAPLLAITGRAASGKTETLARRYAMLFARDATLRLGATIVTAARPDSAAALAERIFTLLPVARAADADRAYVGAGLDRLAFDMLAEHATLSGLAYDLEAIGLYDAEEIFERAIAPLFSADWNEYLGPDIDPEIPGLRAPDRFAVAVLRLIRKLRDAQIDPAAFLSAALQGANAFYANPPNLCAPSLLFATKDEHRGALAVEVSELERQRRRELDLAKIIAKVYQSYLDALVAHGCLTASDAIAEATRLLDEHPALARRYRQRFRIALVDDAHDLHTGEFRLLQAVFGKTLAGVTIAGDPDAATQTFAGARPERVFGAAAVTLELQTNYRVPAQIDAVVQALLHPSASSAEIPVGEAVRLYSAAHPADEVSFVADSIATQIAAGTSPARIAVLHRSLRTLAPFEDALIDRDIAIALHGDAALFTRHDTLDALSLLWSTIDPFAHAWLLRVLQMPFLAVSDATLAILCGEPSSAQGLLFDLPPQAESDGSRRWDRRRDLRLGTNVVRGDRDADLESGIRARLIAFRARRLGWQRFVEVSGVADAVKALLTDGGMYERRLHETPARARRRASLVDALIAVIARYAQRNRGDDLHAALMYCERIARSEPGPMLDDGAADAVIVASIDRIKARRFDYVFVVDVKAGSFPPYYVPDAFLFSPTYGMIPKDSVGEAITARTAKFTWYSHQAKLRENYSREDRRALSVALARADIRATVSASGRATRGVAAPELMAELQAMRPAISTANALVAGPVSHYPRVAVASPHSTHGQLYTAVPARVIPVERVAEMLRCIQCAPRRTVALAVDAALTLLAGRLASQDDRIEERDIAFALPVGSAIVTGTVHALLAHEQRAYIVALPGDLIAIALAIAGLGSRVADDAFFTDHGTGLCSGPHAIEPSTFIDRAASVIDARWAPLCDEHEIKRDS